MHTVQIEKTSPLATFIEDARNKAVAKKLSVSITWGREKAIATYKLKGKTVDEETLFLMPSNPVIDLGMH